MIHSIRSSSSTPDPSSECDQQLWDPQRDILTDKITVLINGYSESRIPLLQSLAATYTSLPIVSSVLVLWGNPSTSPQTLSHLSHNLSLSSFSDAPISLHIQPTTSLNSRFLPRHTLIKTRAVLICDDDIEVDRSTIEFCFDTWRSNPDRLIGLFVRSHEVDMINKEWIYTVHPNRYSMVLTKFMMLKREYLGVYSCRGGDKMRRMRTIVDQMSNCEDILMNFVVADESNVGPVMIGAVERVRDWGDPRNDYEDGGNGVRDVGLSSRRSEHRKKRGKCIQEFHRVLGRMPLRFSYGKLVNSVGEQALCKKKGKLVNCDHF
ncbi:hypothetical protein ACFE04_015498 [Oxalis oulophora]